MSLTDARRIAELSPSRLAIVLFVDCFNVLPQLKCSPDFWSYAASYVNDPSREPSVFDQLLDNIPDEQLCPYIPLLASRLVNADALETTVKSVYRRCHDGTLPIQPKSFIGCLCCDQAALLDMIDIYTGLNVWRNLLVRFAPFARALGHDIPKQSRQLLQSPTAMTLGSAASAPSSESLALSVYTKSLNPIWCLEYRDVEATLDNYYRALDLNGRQSHDGLIRASAPEQRAKPQELAVIYESFGHVNAALEALSQAFASERRRLIMESRDADISRPSAADSLSETRAMVRWLYHILAHHGSTAKIPPELDLHLSQVQDYLRQTASTLDEKAEVASIDMNQALDSGSSSESLVDTAMHMIQLYPSHLQTRNIAIKNCTFHLLLSRMWYRFGNKYAWKSHITQAMALARNSDTPSLKSHLISELSFCQGFEFGDLVEGIILLAEATGTERFNEGVQYTRVLLFVGLYMKAHNFEAAQNLLEELEDVTLNKFQLRTKQALQLCLMTFMGNYYEGYVFADNYIRHLPKEERHGYQAVYFRLSGARALVQSQDPLNAIEARCWISECLRISKQAGYSNFQLEAAILEARLFYNEGDYRSCNALCQALEQDMRASPQTWLYCEWQVLNAVSTQLMTGETIHLDPEPFQRVMYTEFGDILAVPRLATVCLRPRIAVSAVQDIQIENPISDVLIDMLEGRLKAGDFRQAITSSYVQFVEVQNKWKSSDQTPLLDVGLVNLSTERSSFIIPPLEDEPGGTSTPPPQQPLPDIQLESPMADEAHEEITVSKRLRPLSGSPRKGHKRRSLKLE